MKSANAEVLSGDQTIDLLGIQVSIDNLVKVFFANGIRDEVLTPTQIVGPLLDVCSVTLASVLTASTDTLLPLDTVFKVQDLSNSLTYLGSVALNLAFALQTWDYTTIG